MAGTSRVNREVYARFCGRLEVKSLRPTRRLTSPGSDLSRPFIADFGRSAFPARTDGALHPPVGNEISRFPGKERPCMLGSATTPNRNATRDNATPRVAFRVRNPVGVRICFFRGSTARLHDSLPTLRPVPHGTRRTARGRCGSLHLHRRGLPPPTPCRSPDALRISRQSTTEPVSNLNRAGVQSVPVRYRYAAK